MRNDQRLVEGRQEKRENSGTGGRERRDGGGAGWWEGEEGEEGTKKRLGGIARVEDEGGERTFTRNEREPIVP